MWARWLMLLLLCVAVSAIGKTSGTQRRALHSIHIGESADVTTYRNAMIEWLFAGTMPSEVGTVATATNPISLTGVSTTEDITSSAYPNSKPLIWTPSSSNGEVIIMHQGHTWGYDDGDMDVVIQDAIDAGYTVCGMVMPGGATTNISGSSANHTADEDPLGDFIGPVVVAVNTLIDEGYTDIYMIGVSGGGWTTTLSAAVDSRIDRSYPIAGSLPMEYLVTADGTGFRDWEQDIISRGAPATYQDMYLMGSAGSGRRQKQILHTTDDCCFELAAYETGQPYADVIADRALDLGGDYDLVFYAKTVHQWYADVFADEVIADLP